jgi:hypothetical protein
VLQAIDLALLTGQRPADVLHQVTPHIEAMVTLSSDEFRTLMTLAVNPFVGSSSLPRPTKFLSRELESPLLIGDGFFFSR